MPLLVPSVNGLWKGSRFSQGEALCLSALNQARTPYFYENWGVPDTLEGRFDCAVLHISLLLRQLKGPLAQAVFDAFFAYTELTLREIGVSDLRVGKQVKMCAKFFYGALKAYEDGLEKKAGLEEAIIRNLYGGALSPCAEEVGIYIKTCDQALKTQDLYDRKLTSISWPSL